MPPENLYPVFFASVSSIARIFSSWRFHASAFLAAIIYASSSVRQQLRSLSTRIGLQLIIKLKRKLMKPEKDDFKKIRIMHITVIFVSIYFSLYAYMGKFFGRGSEDPIYRSNIILYLFLAYIIFAILAIIASFFIKKLSTKIYYLKIPFIFFLAGFTLLLYLSFKHGL